MNKYKVLVDDNFHFRCEEDRWELGILDSPERAIAACRELVEKSLRDLAPAGKTAAQLYAEYEFSGDDPFIVVLGDARERIEFSARAYARQLCDRLCAGPDAAEPGDGQQASGCSSAQ